MVDKNRRPFLTNILLTSSVFAAAHLEYMAQRDAAGRIQYGGPVL